MSKARWPEQLNEALETMMASSESPASELDPRVADLLTVVAELRDLPSPAFKAALKAELLSRHSSAARQYGRPVSAAGEIEDRLQELGETPGLIAYDVGGAFEGLPDLTMRLLASLDQYTVGVTRFSTQQPLWERHPAGDELLHVMDGALDVTTMTEDGPVHTTVHSGEILVCPRGLWHWPRPIGEVSILFLTAGEGTRHSRAQSPPKARRRTPGHGPVTLTARNIGDVLKSVPELNITSETTSEQADASVGRLGQIGEHSLGVMRYSGQTPWERHPDGDEFLHALDGEAEITVLTDDGPVHRTVKAGSVFICPRGLWHRQTARPGVTMLFATQTRTTQVSFGDDPRR